LHRAPESGALPVVVKRGGEQTSLHLDLPANWRAKSDISHRVGTWPLRGMATGGLVLEDLTDEQRSERGLSKEQLALLVRNVGQYGKNAAAKKAGFQKDDLIVEIDGRSDRMTEGELIGYLLKQHRPDESVKTVLLRGTGRVAIGLPMQ